MTSAWKGLETLTAWSDDMRLSFDFKGRRVVCTFTFNNLDEFFLWQDYNRESALVYTYSRDLLDVVRVQVDLIYFMQMRFKYGLRAAPKDSESEI